MIRDILQYGRIIINLNMRLIWRNCCKFTNKKLIEPQPAELTQIEDNYLRAVSQNYEFIIKRRPPSNYIYLHECNTPAALLKKPGIHILQASIPDLNKREKYSALKKRLQQQFENAYRNCRSGKQIFHLQRKIKMEMRNKLYFVGLLDGKKHKHNLAYRSFGQYLAQLTEQEYEKKGVHVQLLNNKIYPLGKVWLPTNQKYLLDFAQYIKKISNQDAGNALDLGCGSGILSFLFLKTHKHAHLYGLDKSLDAVKTFNVNASRLSFHNAEAFPFDITHQKDFAIKTLQYKLPKLFGYIMINPPWLQASKMQSESNLVDGVYDDGSEMLQNSIKLAKRLLQREGRIMLIYSDLGQLLGLQRKSIQQICKQSSLLVFQKFERALVEEMGKKSAIHQFKAKAKIITYVIKHS